LKQLAAKVAEDVCRLIEAADRKAQEPNGDAELERSRAEARAVLEQARSEADKLLARNREQVDKARREAESLLVDARAQSEKLLADARAEADKLVRSAREAADATRSAVSRDLQAEVTAMREALAVASSGLDRFVETALPAPNELVTAAAGA
jgi:vacuolar-type H+-ATPase subunit H